MIRQVQNIIVKKAVQKKNINFNITKLNNNCK